MSKFTLRLNRYGRIYVDQTAMTWHPTEIVAKVRQAEKKVPEPDGSVTIYLQQAMPPVRRGCKGKIHQVQFTLLPEVVGALAFLV